ncbi:cupin domain-containing protein [Candidatus Acetothermia bacterium]|nr:cupin domain-containing protein [Candidatus Acetothermia bacterium]
MYFCDMNNRLSKELSQGVRTRTFWADRMLISVLEFASHSIVPNHKHPHEQVGVILEGELYMTIAGETRLMKAGEAYVIPGNVEHGGKTGDKPARVFDTFSPVREEYKY